MTEALVTIAEVSRLQTQSGNTRFVIRDGDGREYTTFREPIARDALAAEGHRARVTFHEQQRGRFTNVYLDAVERLDEPDRTAGPDEETTVEESVEEVAWKTAVDAAPWLLGGEPDTPVPPDELFDRLQPFKRRVAEDIREPPETESSER